MKSCIYFYLFVLITNDIVEGFELQNQRTYKKNELKYDTNNKGLCKDYLGNLIEKFQLYIPAGNICSECICGSTNTYCLQIPCANHLERNIFEFGEAHCVFKCNDPNDSTNRFCYDVKCKLNKKDTKLMRIALVEGNIKSITDTIEYTKTSVGENGMCRDYQGRHVKHLAHFSPLDSSSSVLCVCENGHASSCRFVACVIRNDCETVLMKDYCEYTCGNFEHNGITRVAGSLLLCMILVFIVLNL